MKKSFVLIMVLALVAVLTLSLFACGKDKEPTPDFANDVFTVEQAYAYAEDLGFTGTLEEFIAMLSGKNGADGVGISGVAVNEEGRLIVTLTGGNQIDLGVLPKGEKGDPGENGRDGAPGENGKDGKDGKGIKTVEKTDTDGLTDTYTITFTDDTTTTFTVTNGQNGENGTNGTNGTNGKDGVTPTVSIDADGYWIINGEKTDVLARGVNGTNGGNGTNGANGQNGVDGKGIASIEKTGEDGLVDIYTITFTDDTTTTFTVTNGQNGANGTNGTNGVDGKDGKNAEKEIAELIDVVFVGENNKEFTYVREIEDLDENVQAYCVVAYTDNTVGREFADRYEVVMTTYNGDEIPIVKCTVGDRTFRCLLNVLAEGEFELEPVEEYRLVTSAINVILDLGNGRTVGDALAEYNWVNERGEVVRVLSPNDFVDLGNWTLEEAVAQGVTANEVSYFDPDNGESDPYYLNIGERGFIFWDGTTDLQLTTVIHAASQVAVDTQGAIVAMYEDGWSMYEDGWWTLGNGKIVVYQGSLGANESTGIYKTASTVEEGIANGMIAANADIVIVTGEESAAYHLWEFTIGDEWLYPIDEDLCVIDHQDARQCFTADGIIKGSAQATLEKVLVLETDGDPIEIFQQAISVELNDLSERNFFAEEQEIAFTYEGTEYVFTVEVGTVGLYKDQGVSPNGYINIWEEELPVVNVTINEEATYFDALDAIYDSLEGVYCYRAEKALIINGSAPIEGWTIAYGFSPVTKDMIDLNGFVLENGEQYIKVWIDGTRSCNVILNVTVNEAL